LPPGLFIKKTVLQIHYKLLKERGIYKDNIDRLKEVAENAMPFRIKHRQVCLIPIILNKIFTLSKPLPEKFIESLADAKGFDKSAFLQVHQSGEQLTSVRLNPGKALPGQTHCQTGERILD
jgi:hypothetical protein